MYFSAQYGNCVVSKYILKFGIYSSENFYGNVYCILSIVLGAPNIVNGSL